MKILVTGGLGFIGSHTVIQLLENDHEVVIVDNLCNSKVEVLEKIQKITGKTPAFYQFDLLQIGDLRKVFLEHQFDGVIHLAGLKSVAESLIKPLEYYETNINGTINLLKCMKENNVFNLVYSSSASVYGHPENSPIDETFDCHKANNTYSRTKSLVEDLLKDTYLADNSYKFSILRYFNPVGAHKSGIIGEEINTIPNNLIPIMLSVAKGKSDILHIYGKDYKTKDGTCVRDFIHVEDLADAHVKAIERIITPGVHVYNLGMGKGISILELVKTFNKVNGQLINYDFTDRRPGDLPEYYINADKAYKELGWKPTHTIEDICRDSWNYARKKK